MVNWKSRKLGDWLVFLNGLVVIILINVLLGTFFFRIDLTQEKRYSVKDQTNKECKAGGLPELPSLGLPASLDSVAFRKALGRAAKDGSRPWAGVPQ